ncbi:stalk domain-containing protein [Paenibacillus pinistramenti]|uniref:stalk domain-containing protein n=1 Tax=Paenibacillus pinistramenti TaxID=1768003 RepID=UPI001396B96D|nr:stalk domain-containing protein [Paenibacillus pinistramenti]
MKKLIAGLTIGMLIGSSTMAAAATSSTVQAALAHFKIIVSGQTKTVSSSQLVYKGNTYIQLREAGNLFGYDVSYDSASKTIGFSVKNSSTAWVTLSDFAAANGYTIKLPNADGDEYNIVQGTKILLTADASNLREGEEKTFTATNGKVITLRKYLGSIQLNKADLEDAGLLK